VTHTEDVAVNKAVRGEVTCPDSLANGSISNNVPTPMILANPLIKVQKEGGPAFFSGVTGIKILHGSTLETRNTLFPGFRCHAGEEPVELLTQHHRGKC